jgi:4'-phosphopantetheinyl transferase EntD
MLPANVIVTELRQPGDPALLLPAEATFVSRAAPKRVHEFAAGRLCARRALAEIGVEQFALHVAADRTPIWPLGITGSVTHTAGLCLAAVAKLSDVASLGIDCEVVGAATKDIWPSICLSAELHWASSLPNGKLPAAISLIFSAKEAFYKCQYSLDREWLDFQDLLISVESWHDSHGWFTVRAMRHLAFNQRTEMPVRGSYIFHDRFVATAVAVFATRG